MTMPVPPDNPAAGQTGHLQAHQQLSDATAQLQQLVDALPPITKGTVTLVNGTATASVAAVTASSVILLSRQSPSGTLGHLSVSTVTPGTSFVITSSSATDNSVIGYAILG
jgi:hypothetical protein